MQDRLFGLVLLALSGLVAWSASQLQVNFSYEPLGPKAFPLLLSALLALSAIYLVVKPSPEGWQTSSSTLMKLGGALVAMWIYATIYEPLGFVIATIVIGSVLSWMFGEQPKKAVIFSAVMSVVSYFLLTELLQLNVPLGHIFGG